MVLVVKDADLELGTRHGRLHHVYYGGLVLLLWDIVDPIHALIGMVHAVVCCDLGGCLRCVLVVVELVPDAVTGVLGCMGDILLIQASLLHVVGYGRLEPTTLVDLLGVILDWLRVALGKLILH